MQEIAGGSPLQTRCVALFDLDGTLTWNDTLLPFLAGYLIRHPARWPRSWQIVPAFANYFALGRDRGRLKSRMIRIIMGGVSRAAVDAWAEQFVAELAPGRAFRPAALSVLAQHRADGDRLVLLSASPSLYVPRIGTLLGFERTLCTEVKWRVLDGVEKLDGALVTANRRGQEKSLCLRWLRTQYPGMPIVAYGNSASDLPHMKEADRAVLVNAGAAARRAAADSGIAVDVWD